MTRPTHSMSTESPHAGAPSLSFRPNVHSLEVPVIDGGSSDATAKIAARFPLSRRADVQFTVTDG